MIDNINEYPTEAECGGSSELISIRGDEYSQIDEFSDADLQPWDNEFCQDFNGQLMPPNDVGCGELPVGDMVVVRDEYSQESFVRNREKPQKSSKSEFNEALKGLNKGSGRGRKKQQGAGDKNLGGKPIVTKDIQSSEAAVTIPSDVAAEKADSHEINKSVVGAGDVELHGAQEPPVEQTSKNKSVDKKVDVSKDGGVNKRKYDKEGKKNRVDTITKCVMDNFSNREFTLADVKEIIKSDIEKWELSGVSNIDVELSVCVKSMGVEVIGQAPRASGQRGRPSNIMRLLQSV